MNELIARLARIARLPILTIALIGLCLAAGCNSHPSVNDGDIAYIETEGLVGAIAKSEKKPIVLVDARTTNRYEMAHIPGAINIPMADAKRDDKRLRDAKTIIVYALDWEDPVAMAMSKKLMALGYKGVQTYRGGLREWVEKGHDTEPPLDALGQ